MKFIKVYNEFYNEHSNYFLTPNELYLYCILSARINLYWDYTETTIDVLSKLVKYLNTVEKPDRNKRKIKEIIHSLINKDIIECKGINDTKYNELIYITFNKIPGGFEKINPDYLFKTNVPEEFYLLCLIKRFNNSGYEKSYYSLGQLIGCKKSNAESIIDNMISKKLISKVSGKYIDENRQETNTYYLFREDEVDEIVSVYDDNEQWEDKIKSMMQQCNLPVVKTNKEEFCIFRDSDEFNINDIIGVYYIKRRYECTDDLKENPIYEGFDLYKFKYIDVVKYADQIRGFLKNRNYIYSQDILELKKKTTPLYSLE